MKINYIKQNDYLIKNIEEQINLEQEDIYVMLINRLNHYKNLFIEKFSSPVSINNCFRKKTGEVVCFYGLVFSRVTTKNGHIILEIEDESGIVKVLVNKSNINFKHAKELVLDTCVGIKGKVGEEIVFLQGLVKPQIFLPKKQKKLNKKIYFVNSSKKIIHNKNTDHIIGFGKVVDNDLFFPQQTRKELPQIPQNKGLINPSTIITPSGVKVFLYWDKNNTSSIKQITKNGHISPVYGKNLCVANSDSLLYIDSDVDIVVVYGSQKEQFSINGTLCIGINDSCVLDLATYKVSDV